MKSNLFILAFLITFSAFSQERKILGRILDFDTQRPVQNANVVVPGTTLGVSSNRLGFFELSIDPSKHKTIVVSHIGFKTSILNVPSEERFKFFLEKEYVLLSQLDLYHYPKSETNILNSHEHRPGDGSHLVVVESGSSYPDGIANFYDLIGNSLGSPLLPIAENGFNVTFTINESGQAVNVVVSDSAASIREAVMQSFEKMPAWIPAAQGQNNVPQHFVLPIVRLKADVTSLDLRNFYEFISKNIKYPAQARRMGVEGAVYVEFLSDNSGNVLSTKTLKDIGAGCGDEVRRIIAAVPKDLIRSLCTETRSVNFILPVFFGLGRPFKNLPFVPESDALLLGEIDVTAMGVERETRVLGNSYDVQRDSHTVGIPVINAFTSLSRAMKQPKTVKRLSLTNNGLNTFPSDILKLTNLEFLDLEKNQIQILPNEIAGLTKLEELYVLGNQIQRLPGSLGNLKKLRILGLAYNQLETFPLEITSLENLEALDLSDNQLSLLPREIGGLKNLRFLVLRNNQITSIPQEFDGLKKLQRIDLAGNPINQKDIDLLKARFNKTEIVFWPKNETHSSASPIVKEQGNALGFFDMQVDSTAKPPADEVYLVVEDPASFPGGMQNFYDYVSKNIKTPKEVRSRKVSGKVFVEFVIDSTGQIPPDDVMVGKGLCRACDEEAIRVVKESPNWNPGLQKGKPVRQRMVLPIMFR